MQSALYTIGHSNLGVEEFLKLLQDNGIQVVVDVRSAPYSRHALQFNKKEIEAAVNRAGIRYIYLGDVLGGRPADREYLDEDGRVRYDRLAAADTFQQGLDRLTRGLAADWAIALMCAEEDPLRCHRHHLIARELELQRNVAVWHIRADNSRMRAIEFLRSQLSLF